MRLSLIILCLTLCCCKINFEQKNINFDSECYIYELKEQEMDSLINDIKNNNTLNQEGIDIFENEIENGIYCQINSKADYLIIDISSSSVNRNLKSSLNKSDKSKLDSLTKSFIYKDYVQSCHFETFNHLDFTFMYIKYAGQKLRYFSYFSTPNDLTNSNLNKNQLILRDVFQSIYFYYYEGKE
tara:strand:- start:57644 stop:58195 length:552 start_codon:yes stop_codon:yes gene_type:complete